jgi:hypothetical protein
MRLLAVLVVVLLAAPCAEARPGDPDQRLGSGGRKVFRLSPTATSVLGDGSFLIAASKAVRRVRGSRVLMRWSHPASFAELVPRPDNGAWLIRNDDLVLLAPTGTTRIAGRLPKLLRRTVLRRPDGGLLVIGSGGADGAQPELDWDLTVRLTPVSPEGVVGAPITVSRADGRPFENFAAAVPDGAGGAWAVAFEGEVAVLIRIDGAGRVLGRFPGVVPQMNPNHYIYGTLRDVPGIGPVVDGTAGQRVLRDAGPGTGLRSRNGLPLGADPGGRVLWLGYSRGGRVLLRTLPDGRRDRSWPRAGVPIDRGLPNLRRRGEDRFTDVERVAFRRDGTIDLLLSTGGELDDRIDITRLARAAAVVRLEGDDLVRVRRASERGARVRCLASARGSCRVSVFVGGRVRRAVVAAGAEQTVRMRARRGARVLVRAVDEAGRVASDRRRVR